MAGITIHNLRTQARWRRQDEAMPSRLVAGVYEKAVVIGGLLIWGVGGVVFSFAAIPGFFLERRAASKLGRALLQRTFRFFLRYLQLSGLVRMDFDDLERLARRASNPRSKPMILAPNHPSLLDAVFIIAFLPDVTCIMKASLLRNPFLRGGAKLAGFICNDSPRELVRQSVIALQQGSNLLIFPEGTRTSPAKTSIGDFKGGVALISSLTGVPVQPVYICSTSNYLSKGWPVHRLPRFPIHYSAKVGESLSPQRDEKVRPFLQRMQETYRRHLLKAAG